MNHYDELGIPSSATSEEIREAYRGMARLLHPDQQQDPGLRRLADIQMKRLNAVYAVLSDPERRRRYDAELNKAGEREEHHVPSVVVPVPPPPIPPRMAPRRWGSLAWLGAAILGISGLGWYLAPQDHTWSEPSVEAPPETPAVTTARNPQTPSPAEARPPAAQTPVESPVPANVAPVSAPAAEQPAVPQQAATSRVEETKPAVAATPTVQAAAPAGPGDDAKLAARVAAKPPAAPQPAARTEETRAPEPEVQGFSGTWFFTRARFAGSPGLYPPEFIETTISEEDGAIRGRYRARYHVADKPISPDVVFYFEGPVHDKTASLRWSAGNGARGEVRLKLLTDNSMEVAWTATDLGRSQGLASGTAVLVRRRDP